MKGSIEAFLNTPYCSLDPHPCPVKSNNVLERCLALTRTFLQPKFLTLLLKFSFSIQGDRNLISSFQLFLFFIFFFFFLRWVNDFLSRI